MFYRNAVFRYRFSRNNITAVCLIEMLYFHLRYSAVLHETWPLTVGFLYSEMYKPFIMTYFSLSTASIEWCQDHRILYISIRHCCQLVPFFSFFFHAFSSGSMWSYCFAVREACCQEQWPSCHFIDAALFVVFASIVTIGTNPGSKYTASCFENFRKQLRSKMTFVSRYFVCILTHWIIPLLKSTSLWSREMCLNFLAHI